MQPAVTSSNTTGPVPFWEKFEKVEKDKDYKISRTVLEQLTQEAFEVFDPEKTLLVEKNDVGNIIRFLGLNPSQQEIKELTAAVEENGRVSFSKLQEKLINILMNNTMVRDDESKLKRAFQVVDQEKKGYVEPEKLAALLSAYGEPFSKEEIDDMFQVAVEPDKGVIMYNDYASLLAND